MKEIDLILGPIYFLLIYLVANNYRKKYYSGTILYKYFMQGFLIKIFGSLMIGLVYQYYYEGGDTYNFYQIITTFWETFWRDPGIAWELFNLEANDYSKTHLWREVGQFYSWYFKEPSAFFVSKIGTIIAFFCFNSYAVIAIIFASLSFIGMWSLFVTFYNAFPHLHKKLAYAILFVPSVWFWGSGVFKDTITIGCIGLSTYYFFDLFVNKKIKIFNILIFLLCIYLTYRIKVYLVYCFIPAFLLTIFYLFKNKIKSIFIRKITTPLILGVSLFVSFQFISNILVSGNLQVDEMIVTIQNTQQWHGQISEEGRAYSLGQIEYTLTGILSKSFLAIEIALFEPFIWNANGPFLLASAIENLFILILTVQTILITKNKIIKYINENPFLIYGLTFTFLLAFIVGFTTYNYGALVRYKIPLIPFYLSSLIILIDLSKQKRIKSS